MLQEQGVLKRERLVELDLAKSMALVVMVFFHALLAAHVGGLAVIDNSFRIFVIFKLLGSVFGATVFMFSMGVTLTYTRNTTAEDYLRRGVRLLLVGLFFNLVYYSLSIMAGDMVLHNKVDWRVAVEQLFSTDILLLAGTFHVFFGLLHKARCKKMTLLLVVSVGAVVAGFFRYSEVTSLATNIVINYFVGLDCYAEGCFPLFNWSLIIVAGYFWGIYTQCKENRLATYRKLLILSLPITVAFIVLGVRYDLTFFADFWYGKNHMFWYEQILCAISVFTLLGLFSILAPHLPEKVLSSARFLGKNLTKIYIIHWLLIMWVQYFFLIKYCGFKYDFWEIMALGVLWLTLSVGIASIKG